MTKQLMIEIVLVASFTALASILGGLLSENTTLRRQRDEALRLLEERRAVTDRCFNLLEHKVLP